MKKPWKSGANAAPGAQPVDIQQSAIRGRISGPVPISTSLDDEFPIRNPGTNIATPVQNEFQESQPEPTPSRSDFRSPTLPETRRNGPHSFREEPRLSIHARQPGTPSRLQKAEPSSNARHSFVSSDRTQNKDKERPQRKQSTLRGALGKLFNRKKRANDNESTGNTDSEAGSVPVRPGPYRRSTGEDGRAQDSVPSLSHKDRSAPRARSRPFPGAESKRSASLPITEFDRALRSHSIRPEDVRAIESARNSLSADFGLTHAAKLRECNLAGLSPRPASSHGRESRQDQHDENVNEIGRAITSDLPGVRRRSRSLSGLPDDSHIHTRRRSDEIKYWRESYDPTFMHPMSSNVVDGEDGVAAEADYVQHGEEEDSQQQQAEPFNFGSFADMKQVGSMKITHAANMETRINNLESRVYQLEQVLDRMRDNGSNRQSHLDPPDRAAPPIPIEERYTAKVANDQADWTERDNRRGSRRLDGHQKAGQRGSMFLDLQSPAILDGSKDRPTSTATVRGTTSLPSLLKDAPEAFTMDHYTTLLALIHTERSARQALETQVRTLGHQLSILSNSAAMNGGYDPPPTAKSFGDRSAFDHDDDDDNLASLAVITRSHSRHVDPEDSGIGTGHGDDSEYSDTFETPREESGHNFGAFGEDLDREDQAQTKAARTLSLSQLTMGRGTQKSSQHLRRVI
ncbi:uncharacterized protein FIESC28_06151 [Fusarium coffeatum]|uniref:Uncharacterized protein n=1 Tax=Fusarium coffeatum TaxID=231269 RepID=A0A366RPD2_9HYPO|nr:uncharacterized protein FIESC28_06151 [Fusarium coffeatum]RBR18378.1 hypothetical protein FIESC28_06151 [Fusarium coffeatum]